MEFAQGERVGERRTGWGVDGGCVCAPFIAQLSRKSLLMEHHLQGISPLLRPAEGERMCASENRDGGRRRAQVAD